MAGRKDLLSGLLVLEYGEGVAAPFCGRLLADLGARVIKIERPRVGDRTRRHGPFPGDAPHHDCSGRFLALNLNKEGITLDVRTPTGADILTRLVEQADILVEDVPLHDVEALRLDYPTLSALNPKLVVTDVTPFGRTGPYAGYRGGSLIASALGGSAARGSEGVDGPLSPPFDMYEHQTAVNAAGATVAAILARFATGRGQHVDISTVDVTAVLHVGMYIWDGLHEQDDGPPARGGVYPSGFMRCKDGYVVMNAPQVAQWIRFLELLGPPEWSSLPRYRNRRAMAQEYPEEVDALLAPWFMEHTRQEIFDLCRAQKVPFAPVFRFDEIVSDQHLRSREFFEEVDDPQAGTHRYPGSPYHFAGIAIERSTPAPRLGEHNQRVYGEMLGLDRSAILALSRTGVI